MESITLRDKRTKKMFISIAPGKAFDKDLMYIHNKNFQQKKELKESPSIRLKKKKSTKTYKQHHANGEKLEVFC